MKTKKFRYTTVAGLIAQLRRQPPRARVMVASAPPWEDSCSAPLYGVAIATAGRDGAGTFPPEGRVSVSLFPLVDVGLLPVVRRP